MKNLILLLSFCLVYLSIYAQTEESKECSNDELVLLNERPDTVSEREALKIIRGQKERTLTKTWCYHDRNSLIPPKLKATQYTEYARLGAIENGETLPRWKLEVVEENPEIIEDSVLIAWWCISFILSFVFVNLMVADINHGVLKDLRGWLINGAIGNLILCLICFTFYTLAYGTGLDKDMGTVTLGKLASLFVSSSAGYFTIGLITLALHWTVVGIKFLLRMLKQKLA